MLLQGIRVFFGATFLMQASEVLPQTFGILDGFTHIGAGLPTSLAWPTSSSVPAPSP
ncbi:MAG: hypothetical protein IPL70_16070 [Uliginosibacterium sp.]|nr:hypothetical protein [Uliginosibacterium sp.]